jgi:hypothetical protein
MECCERGTIPSLPTGSIVRPPDRPSAPMTAVVPLADPLRDVLVARSVWARGTPPRAHLRPTPLPLSAAASCARLRVFLI